jgi:hypothetical protein
MSLEHIRLSPEFKFFLTFHFSLGFSIEYSANKDEQLTKLREIKNSLNDSLKDHEIFSGYKWEVQKFDEEFPLLLQAKYGYLVGESTGPTEELEQIIKNKNESWKPHGVQLDSESLKETIVYFDYGVGSVNLVIKGRFDKLKTITHFLDLSLSIQEDIQICQEKSLRVFDNWHDFRESMRQAFGNSLNDIWGIRLLKGEERHRTRVVGTGALLYIEGNSNLEQDELDKLSPRLFDFAGLKVKKNDTNLDTIDKNGAIYLAQGYDGHIAIISNDKQETWLTNLWQFITDHYACVRDLEKILYTWALFLSNEKQTPDPEDVRKALNAIPRIELSIDILTHESLPHNFAGKGDERKVYQGIYEAWDTEKAVQSLKDKLKTLSGRFNYLNWLFTVEAEKRSSERERWLNYLVLTLAIITLVSVSKDIYDFKSSHIDVGYIDVLFSLSYAPKLCMLGLGVLILYYILSLLVRKK